jgi:hypothetical protein
MADRRELDALTIQQATTSREVEAMDSLISQLVGEVASARGRRGAATTKRAGAGGGTIARGASDPGAA